MNIKELHTTEKEVSAVSFFKSEQANATALQILKGGKLSKHITKVPALLICLEGKVIFGNDSGSKLTLFSGDYIHIEPEIIHWIEAEESSQLLLIK
ncbi:MAG TPA: hypothetical protein PLU53_04300 [Bacteroidia bacterium]|nr:hypothetical protein [Bacteroidia bacterium]